MNHDEADTILLVTVMKGSLAMCNMCHLEYNTFVVTHIVGQADNKRKVMCPDCFDIYWKG